MSLQHKYSKNKKISTYLSNLLQIDVKHNGLTKCKLLKNNTNVDEIKGLPYLCHKKLSDDGDLLPILVKIFPRDIEDTLDNSFTEIIYLVILNDFVLDTRISPNIPALYHYFINVPNNSMSLSHVPFKKIQKINKIKDTSNIFFCEYFPHKDIDSWIENNYNSITEAHWKSIIFQVIHVLAVLQHKFHFMHNDLHPGNVLIDSVTPDTYLTFKLFDKTYYVENTGYIPKLWDFEFSNMFKDEYNEYRNIIEFDIGYNKSYDPHVFLKGLLQIPELPINTRLFIESMYPQELLYNHSTKIINTSTDTLYLKNGSLTESAFETYKTLPTPEIILDNQYFKEYHSNNYIDNNTFIYNSI